MYKPLYLTLGAALTLASFSGSASGEERYISVTSPSGEALSPEIFRYISLDHGQDPSSGEAKVYIDDGDPRDLRTLRDLRGMGLTITPLPHPGDGPRVMAKSVDDLKASWRAYPTYEQYTEMMADYALSNPDLAAYINLGESQEGRAIQALRLGDNPTTDEDEPAILLTSTMHGDETTGYVTLLRLIDTLLTGYGTDPEITRLMDNVEIWINPLANPDGTYRGGNDTVSGARRALANGVDPNRNFPDPEDGPHPDGRDYAPETLIMMDLAEAQSFTLAANLHGGAEVVNYPWDTWPKAHADEGWFVDICRAWADSAQDAGHRGYMTDYDDGITNGYDWYEVNGGRQDYTTYWQGTREITLEISSKKTIPGPLLPRYWEANRQALLDFIGLSLTGIRGTVTGPRGAPLPATITIVGHDKDGSEVFSDPRVGDFHRLISPGTYTLKVEAPGFSPEIIEGVSVRPEASTRVDVILQE